MHISTQFNGIHSLRIKSLLRNIHLKSILKAVFLLATLMLAGTMAALVCFPTTTAAQTETSTKYITYQIKSGDTLGSLAEYFGTSVANIKSVNGLTDSTIYIGQRLKISAQYIDYRVVSGDTLYRIAVKYRTTINKIMLFNGLTNYDIYVGQVLHIPHISEAPSVTYITHTVAKGENVWTISIKYGIPQQELLNVNKLTQSSTLSIGQKITIPVYTIPVRPTPGPQFGEYLDWFTEAQYLFPIGKKATVVDFVTGKSFNVQRTIGASHADCEPQTTYDAGVMKNLWGGNYSWSTRSALVVVDGRKIAASVSSEPHGTEYIAGNGFTGHFDIHFKNSRRHKDNLVDESHQAKVRIAAGVNP